jgi:hypothetical protein
LRFHLYGDCTRLQSGFLLLLLLLLLLEVFVITFCGCNFPILLHFLRFFLLHFVQKKRGNSGEKVVVVEVRQGNLSLLRL